MGNNRQTNSREQAHAKRKWYQRRPVIIALVLVLLVIIGFIIASLNRHDDHKSNYHIITVGKQADLVLTGKVDSVQKQVLELPSGKVQQLQVKNGDHVISGQTLLTTYNANAQDSAAELQSDLQKSQQTMQSQQQTIASLQKQMSGMSSGDDGYADLQSQLNEARSAYSDAQASANLTQNRLNNTNNKVNQTLTAPYSGYVMIDNSKQGAPVLTLYSDSLQFTGEVSEYDYNKLHNGTNLHVKALATNHRETTPVSYLSEVPSKDSGNNNAKYQVTANLNAERFTIGQTAKASIIQDGFRIPKSAVRNKKVYIVDSDDKTRAAKVSGHAVNSYYIVTDGVNEGDKIITNPNAKLKNGTKVALND